MGRWLKRTILRGTSGSTTPIPVPPFVGRVGPNFAALPAVGTSPTTARPTLTDYTALRNQGIGATRTDSRSGVVIQRHSPDGAPLQNEYGSGGPWVSPYDTTIGGHYAVQRDTTGGGSLGVVVDLIAGSTVASPRRTPTGTTLGLANNSAFSYVTPNVLYSVTGDRYLRKYSVGANSLTELTGGGFPVDLTPLNPEGSGVWAGRTTQWLMHSDDDSVFVVSLPNDGILVYYPATGTTKSILVSQLITAGVLSAGSTLDEGYLEPSGRYVVMQAAGPTATLVWDLQTDKFTTPKDYIVHGSVVYGALVASAGSFQRPGYPSDPYLNNADGWGYMPINPVTTMGQAGEALVFNETQNIYQLGKIEHTAAQYLQPGKTLAQTWVVGEKWYNQYKDPSYNHLSPDYTANRVTGVWSVYSGFIYTAECVNHTDESRPPAWIIESDATNKVANITTMVGSAAAITGPGMGFIDNTVNPPRAYVWRYDSASPENRWTTILTDQAIQGGVYAFTVGGSPKDVRHLAWTAIHPLTHGYYSNPFVMLSPDGRIAVWNTDFGVLGGELHSVFTVLPT